jgi:hypothetical protein
MRKVTWGIEGEFDGDCKGNCIGEGGDGVA